MTYPVTLAPLGGKRACGILTLGEATFEVTTQYEPPDRLHMTVLDENGHAVGHGTLLAASDEWRGLVEVSKRRWAVRGRVGTVALLFCDPAGVEA